MIKCSTHVENENNINTSCFYNKDLGARGSTVLVVTTYSVI